MSGFERERAVGHSRERRPWFRPGLWATHAALLATGGVVAFPFVWMLLTALKTLPESQQFPPALFPAQPQWSNFAQALREGGDGDFVFLRYFGNSAVVAVGTMAGVVLTALLAGYVFGALEFPGRGPLFALFMATMLIPFEVVMIPNVLTIHRFGWYDRYPGLIVPWLGNAFSVFLVSQQFRSLPREFWEAAQLDGCTHWQYLWRVGRPLVLPALATAGLFAFLASWNSLLWPLLASQSPGMRTIELGLSVFLSEEQTQFHLVMAISALTMLPVLLVFFLAQRTFIEGVSAGVKG